ncbi:3'-5' exonuclease [Mycolicibacterium sp. BiH015]|uniref:3'-5' exonuclease n=1 Tax=Mycolicibacterium sp. BiH015 TaxID=3018808 RepID=UPI0022E8D13A|nr:3'-5' exonuclease [Mycolicibacterium sp. BiH015]MDA2893298.1 3'-5' exonuclease [Mycolicibacterium sp. BiH015]
MTRWLRRRGPGPFDRPWRDIDYAVVDLETTGLNLRHDTIASYGVAVISNGRMLTGYNTYGLVRPECTMSRESITVHALRPADLDDAPPLSQAVDVLGDLLADRVMIAHAAWIERAFLTRAFSQHGRKLSCRIIDTAAMARAADLATSRGEPDLERLATALRLPVVSPHHALGDAITTGYVFLALAARLGERGYHSVRDFIDLTEADRRLRP